MLAQERPEQGFPTKWPCRAWYPPCRHQETLCIVIMLISMWIPPHAPGTFVPFMIKEECLQCNRQEGRLHCTMRTVVAAQQGQECLQCIKGDGACRAHQGEQCWQSAPRGAVLAAHQEEELHKPRSACSTPRGGMLEVHQGEKRVQNIRRKRVGTRDKTFSRASQIGQPTTTLVFTWQQATC